MEDTCQIEGCPRPIFVKSRGWCRRHYYRWYNNGDPLKAKYDRDDSLTDEQRWWAKVNQTEDCWLWTSSVDKRGYGQFDTNEFIDGQWVHKNHRAHRWGYNHFVRILADDEEPDHLCRVHECVRFDHLDPVSHAENVARGLSGNHNAIKTHCKQGHEFTPENTRHPARGGRECRTCNRLHVRDYMRRKRAATKAAKEGEVTHGN